MQKFSAIILAILFCEIAISQNTYFKVLSSPFTESAGATIETGNGDLLMLTEAGSFTNLEYIKILKINTFGDTIASRKIKMQQDYYYFSKIFRLSNDEFVAVGASFNFATDNMHSVDNKEIFFTFNSNLDSLSFKEILMYENEIMLFSMRDAVMNSYSHIVTLCEDMSKHNITLLETNYNGDSIRSSHLQPDYGVNVYSIMQKKDLTGYCFSVEGDFNHLNNGYISHLVSVDNFLNFVAIDSLTGECAYLSQIRNFNNSLLIGGRARRNWISNQPPYSPPYVTEEYCIEKLDANLNATKQVYLSHVYQNHMYTPEDTISYPAMNQNFDFIDTSNIYTCHYREYPWVMYSNEHNYFVIAKFNANLEMKWQYYFGYDAYYRPIRILATADGGCFVNGIRYDAATQIEEMDIFYLKLDSTGIYTSNKFNTPIHSVIVYPNPGRDMVTIRSGPQVNGALLQLYDINGKPVAEKRIDATLLQLPVQNLPKGVYPWRILKDNKLVDSGKWVKE